MNPNKLKLLEWLGLPLIGLWLTINYFVGLTKNPAWQSLPNPTEAKVLSATSERITISDHLTPVTNQAGGLVTLWFDDAWTSQYAIAAPVLREKNLTAALAVPTQHIGFDAYMTWPQIKRLQHSGWEISSHSRSHNCEPDTLSEEELDTELHGAQTDLWDHGLEADHFVAPCGVTTNRLISQVRQIYTTLRSTETGINPLPISNPYNLFSVSLNKSTPISEVDFWLNQASANNAWLILVFHQIDDSQEEYSISASTFSQIIDLVEQSSLQVVLPGQIL